MTTPRTLTITVNPDWKAALRCPYDRIHIDMIMQASLP
ncbi:hypothetical protein CDEN61S_01769 [Castellaniella denitrificans]